jgi:hypothetical protein
VVRSYDTKAQIVGVGYILALNLALHFDGLLPTRATIGPLFIAVVWGVVILPILQFGHVVYPSRTRAEKELLAKTSCCSEQSLFYVDPHSFAGVGDLVHQALRSVGPRCWPPNCSRHLVSGSSNRRASGVAL